jgi:hypothetical protein
LFSLLEMLKPKGIINKNDMCYVISVVQFLMPVFSNFEDINNKQNVQYLKRLDKIYHSEGVPKIAEYVIKVYLII